MCEKPRLTHDQQTRNNEIFSGKGKKVTVKDLPALIATFGEDIASDMLLGFTNPDSSRILPPGFDEWK